MPTITAKTLESLLRPNIRNPSSKKPSSSPPKQHNDDTYISTAAATVTATASEKPSPSESSLISDSPSPYVINSKRRNILPAVSSEPASRLHGFQIQRNEIDETHFTETLDEEGREEESGLEVEWSGDSLVNKGGYALEREEHGDKYGEDGDFFDPRDSISVASSSSEVDDRVSLRRTGFGNQTTFGSQSDYYDAAEDFFSDGSLSNSSPSFCTNIEKELHALRLNLSEEVERRNKAEEVLLHIHKQWQRIAKCLSQVGLSFPEIQHSGNIQLVPDPEALCQEIIVMRFVSEAVERGLARAEAAAVAESIIDSKNHEISRLRDRLQYYEAVNHEMSQRNQESVELARQQCLRKKARWSLICGCVGLSITVGASLLAYSYFPHSGKDLLPTSSPDASSLSTMDSGETGAC